VNRPLVLVFVLCGGSLAIAGAEHGPGTGEFWAEKLPELSLVLVTILLWWATRALVKGAESTAEHQLRAYVFLEAGAEISVVQGPSTTGTLEIDVRVKNFGQTPAHDVLGHTWVGLHEWPLPEDFNFEGPPGTEPAARGLIPPGGWSSYHTGSARPFSEAEMEGIRSGRLRIYIYGNIKYVDAFTKSRLTNFCYASSTEGGKGFKTAIAKSHLHNNAT
jgi:hypothetical protein